MIRDVVQNHVVLLLTFGEILFCVINDAIGAERSDKIDIPRAAHAGDVRAERFRDLDRERADAAGCAINQDFLP